MRFSLVWDRKAKERYNELRRKAEASLKSREKSKKGKATKDEGLFKQVRKCVKLLTENPRHPGLQTHPFSSIPNPYKKGEKVFEAYAQKHTSRAYRVFWCYGPGKKQITVVAIVAHP